MTTMPPEPPDPDAADGGLPAAPLPPGAFDPYTGQPLAPAAVQPTVPALAFDPMTGQRLQPEPVYAGPVFDPMTGKRLVKEPRNRTKVVVIAGIVLVLVGGAAVGGVLWNQDRKEKKEQRAEIAAENRRVRACEDALSPVYDALVAVDGRMTTGANVSSFGDMVGTASAAFAAVDADVVDRNSCGYHDRLGEIVTEYAAIYSGWNSCIFEYTYCDTDTDIDVGTALTLVSSNLDELGDEIGGEEEPDELTTPLSRIASLVAYS